MSGEPSGPTEGNRSYDVGQPRANSDDWRRYYRRAARIRAERGDPFLLYRARARRRERLLMAASVMVIVGVALTFIVLSGGPLVP